eukprot:594961-Prorocentrum_minimum.AAC.1
MLATSAPAGQPGDPAQVPPLQPAGAGDNDSRNNRNDNVSRAQGEKREKVGNLTRGPHPAVVHVPAVRAVHKGVQGGLHVDALVRAPAQADDQQCGGEPPGHAPHRQVDQVAARQDPRPAPRRAAPIRVERRTLVVSNK